MLLNFTSIVLNTVTANSIDQQIRYQQRFILPLSAEHNSGSQSYT